MMKASDVLLIVGGLAVLAWGGYASLSPGELAADKQALSSNLFPEKTAPANPTNLSHDACDNEPAEGCVSTNRSALGGSLAQELDALRREVARLDMELTAVRRQLDTPSPALGSANPSADPELNEAEAREREQREWQEKAASIEWSFRQEPVDAAWAAHATDKIRQAYELEDLAELLVQAAECRSTLCRVEVALDDQTNQLLPRFALHVADTLPKLTVRPVADGDEWIVLFLTRGDQE